jgi:hypothetical protein
MFWSKTRPFKAKERLFSQVFFEKILKEYGIWFAECLGKTQKIKLLELDFEF